MSHVGLARLSPEDAASAAGQAECPSHVLLIEDDADIRDLLRQSLEGDGFAVAPAANDREALEMLRKGLRPAAILLDLMMPVMDGWGFRYEQLKDPELRHIPVVVASAAGFSAETVRLQLGNVDYIPKPVPYLDLLDTLGRICRTTASAA